MNEATLKRALVKALRKRLPSAVIFRHEDLFTAGIPDLSITSNRPGDIRTSVVWAEVKFDRLRSKSKTTPVQELTLGRLEGIRVTYREFKGAVGIDIEGFTSVGPLVLAVDRGRKFNHDFVANYIAGRLGC